MCEFCYHQNLWYRINTLEFVNSLRHFAAAVCVATVLKVRLPVNGGRVTIADASMLKYFTHPSLKDKVQMSIRQVLISLIPRPV